MTEVESGVIIDVVGVAATKEECEERVIEYYGRESVSTIVVGGDRMEYIFMAKDKDGVDVGSVIKAKRYTNW